MLLKPNLNYLINSLYCSLRKKFQVKPLQDTSTTFKSEGMHGRIAVFSDQGCRRGDQELFKTKCSDDIFHEN